MYSRPAPHSAIALSHAAAVALSSPVPALTASKSLKHVVFLSLIKSLVLGSCVGTARLVKVSSVSWEIAEADHIRSNGKSREAVNEE